MSLNIHSRSVCVVVCEVYAVRSYAYTLLCENVLLCFLSSLRCWTKRTFFLLFLGFFCNKPSRNKVTNRIELKDVSYDSQAPFSNILLENKWARANVIELSEEIRSKMTERRRFKGGMKRQQVSQWEKDGCLLSLSFFPLFKWEQSLSHMWNISRGNSRVIKQWNPTSLRGNQCVYFSVLLLPECVCVSERGVHLGVWAEPVLLSWFQP